MADPDALATTPRSAAPAKPRLSTDARWIVSTGLAIAALLLTLIGTMMQQNLTMNGRIEDINRRIDDINRRIDDTNRMTSQRFDEMQTDIREIRTLLLQILERTAPAD